MMISSTHPFPAPNSFNHLNNGTNVCVWHTPCCDVVQMKLINVTGTHWIGLLTVLSSSEVSAYFCTCRFKRKFIALVNGVWLQVSCYSDKDEPIPRVSLTHKFYFVVINGLTMHGQNLQPRGFAVGRKDCFKSWPRHQ